jgi:hypothetical protein
MNGISKPIGLPQINVAGAFNFGGPRQVPQGRGDSSFVVSDTLSRLSGSHSIKLGGEYRRFFSNFLMTDVGQFNFPNIGSFIETPTRFQSPCRALQAVLLRQRWTCSFWTTTNGSRT